MVTPFGVISRYKLKALDLSRAFNLGELRYLIKMTLEVLTPEGEVN